MVANPALIPLTVVTVRRVLVTPSGMMRFGGNAIAIEGSLLASVMTTPPAGAAAPKVIGKLTVSPGANVTFPGKSIPPAAGCVTATLAVIVTDPAATPVTGTATLVIPVPKPTVAGAEATVALLELRLTTSAAGAGADRFSVRFCVATPLIVRLTGEKLIVVV